MILALSTFLGVSVALATNPGDTPVPTMTPDEAVEAALLHDPELTAVEAALEVAQGELAAASGLRQNPTVEAQFGSGHLEAQARQALSLSGEGLAASRSAHFAVTAAGRDAAWARLETAAEARRAWARTAAGETNARIAAEELAGATRMREIASQRAAAGEGTSFDVHLARLEEARAAGALLEARAEAAAARIALATITGDPAAAADGDPLLAAQFEAGSTTTRPSSSDAGTRQDVLAAEARVDAAKLALRRERAAVVPELELGAFYMVDHGERVVGPSVGMELPLWTWNPAGRATATGDLLRAESEAKSVTAQAAVEGESAVERRRDADAMLALLGADPAGDVAAVLAGIEAAVKAGEMDLSDATLLRARALEGRRAWTATRVAVAEARIDAALATGDVALLP